MLILLYKKKYVKKKKRIGKFFAFTWKTKKKGLVMKEILIVTDLFEKSKTLSDFFITKSTSTKLLNSNDLNKFESPKSTLICSLQFEKKIGGQSNLLKISREIGCTNLIVLNTLYS